MADLIDLAVENYDEYPVEPPIVDSMHLDLERQAYIAQYIPSDEVSTSELEAAEFPIGTPDAKRNADALGIIGELPGVQKVVARFYYFGGGDFTFHFEDKSTAF